MKKIKGIPRVGVALGGGGIRGMAHLGVLQVLEEAKIPIDAITGTSMGGIVAGLYAAGVSVQKMIAFSERVRLIDVASPDRNWRGLFGHKKVAGYLGDLLGREDVTFEDLQVPTAVVAADIETREMVVLDKGPLIPALLATSALPILFSPVYHQGRWLVDGGALNNLPVDVVRSLGANRVLGVSVPPVVELSLADEDRETGLSARGLRFFSNRTRDWRKPFLIAEASMGIATHVVNQQRLDLCPPDVMLEIFMPNVGLLATDKSTDAIEAGRRAATDRLAELTELGTKGLAPPWWVSLGQAKLRLQRAWRALLETRSPQRAESGDRS